MCKRGLILVVVFWMLFGPPFDAGASDPINDSNKIPSRLTLTDEASWPMAAANPERTSWTPEEVGGALKPLWFKPFEPYISQKVQIIAAYDNLYVSTSRGLYALDAETGAEKWVYPTELPLGHSPTIQNGVAYVGGFDHKLHAIDALTGNGLWSFEAGAGFHTNPLVVAGKVYAGNRDGYFYAVYAEGPNRGQLAWKYQTQGPVLYSAAYKDGVVFFASNDSHAYALDAETGDLVWKSAKLPGAGFHSWWPVVYRDRVIFSGSNNYRATKPGPRQLARLDLEDVYPNHETDPRGTLLGPLGTEPGDWVTDTPTIDATRSLEYLNQKPWRQTYFVLDRFTGQAQETAPVLWTGNDGVTNRYPPVVGTDGVLYQQNSYMSSTIPGGQISGWKIGTPYISVVSSDWGAIDEPHAYSAGGNLIYWNLCCDRQAGAFDITIPNTRFADRWNSGILPPTGKPDANREWSYFGYNTGAGNSLSEMLPGYRRFHNPGKKIQDTSPHASFGVNGVYGWHGDTNPPVPYKGKIYMHRSNSLIAFSNSTGDPLALPMAETVKVQNAGITPLGVNNLKARLAQEIQQILDAGHLRPGYRSAGLFDFQGQSNCGDDLSDYWHHPADTLYILIQTLPYLSPNLQLAVKSYLQSEFTAYPPNEYNHIGWRDGATREVFDMPPEVEADLINYPPASKKSGFAGWKRNPFTFYALWKYAEIFGDARNIFEVSQDKLESPPSNEVLVEMPFVHNAFIAGYLGYLELAKLAGYPESASIRTELNRLLTLRATTFSKDSPYANLGAGDKLVNCRTLNIARNFIFLVPELGQYLHDNAREKVQEALDEYYELAPYWFVSNFEDGFAENGSVLLYDSYALLMAKALILQEPGGELEKYLDVPAFERGDLFYIQKLVAILDNHSFALKVTPTLRFVDSGGVGTYAIEVQHASDFTSPVTLIPGNPSPDLTVHLAPATIIAPPGGQTTLTLTDLHDETFSSFVWYTVPITATGGEMIRTVSVGLLVNGAKLYLPLIFNSG